ncbi:MAG: cytidine deaminase [Thermoanaerobaculales bacterium]|nr:cytidine deaminase [Thermoanaerobaculales bacterium]
MKPLEQNVIEDLVVAASRVRAAAHVPYSKFRVGAALMDEDGEVYTGCNVENASYGLSVCAERHAVAAAVAAGASRFHALVVFTNASPPVSPCGACRQVLSEFGNFPVILANSAGERVQTSVEELLPLAFSAADLR